MTTAPVRWRGPAEPLRVLLVAVQFLTRIPVPAIPVSGDDLRRATAAFPAVGFLVGGVVLAARALAEPWLGAEAATVVAVGAGVAVTGAFHEDGLADSVDGLWGGWTPERRVEIMRDSRLGTYGAAALLGTLLLQVTLLAPLPLAVFAAAVLSGHVLGRLAVLGMIRALPAYHDQGTGAQVAEPVGPVGTTVAVLTGLLTLLLALGRLAAVPVVAGLLVAAWLRGVARRRLGGLTGDVLGATQQVVLLASLASVAALWRTGYLPDTWLAGAAPW